MGSEVYKVELIAEVGKLQPDIQEGLSEVIDAVSDKQRQGLTFIWYQHQQH